MILAEPVDGYSTQAQISLDVAAIINNRRIRFYFAAEFNSIENAPTSNPLQIYDELDRAAKVEHHASWKVRTLIESLRQWVRIWENNGFIDQDTRARAMHAIKTALERGACRPLVFYLSGVVGAERGSEPDEYKVENLSLDDPRVRQILPPIVSHRKQSFVSY